MHMASNGAHGRHTACGMAEQVSVCLFFVAMPELQRRVLPEEPESAEQDAAQCQNLDGQPHPNQTCTHTSRAATSVAALLPFAFGEHLWKHWPVLVDWRTCNSLGRESWRHQCLAKERCLGFKS